MIVSHNNKFIFLKNTKTAGTSIEIMLSQFCGPNDIITPIAHEDELLRNRMGFRGVQNSKPLHLLPKGYFNHAPAWYIKTHIGDRIWNSYFKFCIERNPFDKAISRYYYSTRDFDPRPEINNYLLTVPTQKLSNWYIYTINDAIEVDFIGRYEKLNNDISTIMHMLNLPYDGNLPKAKSQYRMDYRHYSRVLNKKSRDHIEVVCAKEIKAFSYEWNTQ